MAILSVTSENPLLWAFLMQNFNLGIAKMSVISENPLLPNPVLLKTSVVQRAQVIKINTPISRELMQILRAAENRSKRRKLRNSVSYLAYMRGKLD